MYLNGRYHKMNTAAHILLIFIWFNISLVAKYKRAQTVLEPVIEIMLMMMMMAKALLLFGLLITLKATVVLSLSKCICIYNIFVHVCCKCVCVCVCNVYTYICTIHNTHNNVYTYIDAYNNYYIAIILYALFKALLSICCQFIWNIQLKVRVEWQTYHRQSQMLYICHKILTKSCIFIFHTKEAAML